MLPRLVLTGLAHRHGDGGVQGGRPRGAGPKRMPSHAGALLGATAAGILARPALIRAQSSAPIRIGEINSYATSRNRQPYRQGGRWQCPS